MEYQSLTMKLIDAFGLHRHPIGLHYQETRPPDAFGYKKVGLGCLIALLKKVEAGKAVAVSSETHGCFGAGFFCGFTGGQPFPGQPEYVSTGIPEVIEGEHYKLHVDLINDIFAKRAPAPAPHPWLVLQRLDHYGLGSSPDVVIFLARPDALAGLHALANIDKGAEDGVIAPFTSGCGAIINEPLLEKERKTFRAVLGLFDPSSRPFEEPGVLSFSLPIERLLQLLEYMDRSFLVHKDWGRLKQRVLQNPGADHQPPE